MPFISYAQNFEDVLLWRALRTVERGFFIDVGAQHPDLDSVTRAFSDRGWHGINIEPLRTEAALIRAARPRDVTLQVAVGDAIGQMPFHVVAGTGLSTLDPEIARSYAGSSFAVSTETIEVLTLARICELHAEPDIHFLKIDVEGAELAVLRGADFGRFRPWIILAEATEPRGTREVHHQWEPLLLAADYVFVWFDGLNRFYVAKERADALRPFFRTPPNVFDAFVRAGDNGWIARFDAADTEARLLRTQLVSVQNGLAQSAERERRHAEHAGHEIDRLREALARSNAGAELARHDAATAGHMFALRHRDMEDLRTALHETRHELQQTHLRLQDAGRERDAALHELQQTHLRLQTTEQQRDAALHELQQTHLRLQTTERERDAALHELQQTHLRLQHTERERDAALHESQQTHLRLQHTEREHDTALHELLRIARERETTIKATGRRFLRRVARGVSRRPGVAGGQPDGSTGAAPMPLLSAMDVAAPTGHDAAASTGSPDRNPTVPGAEPGSPLVSSVDRTTDAEQPPPEFPDDALPDENHSASSSASSSASGIEPGPLLVASAARTTGMEQPPAMPGAEASPVEAVPGTGHGVADPAPALAASGLVADMAAGDPASPAPVEPALPLPLPISPPPPFAIPDGEGGELRTVHQFHSGSAVGDAITNALLMVRGMLRAMGYRSEIFVEQPPATLAHELRTLEELPRHDGYVLLLHHSIGYDRFDQVLALPAPKLLIYHNITPPELLARHPHLAHYAALGREQLFRLRGRVAAALAISEYNGNELRRLGLAPVRTCNLLFDIDALRRRAADAQPLVRTLRDNSVFTILFVGRIAESKNQVALIDAFGVFRARHGAPSRLVLVGRPDTPDDPYLALLRRRIEANGLDGDVLLTGGVSDPELDGWHGAADLYVSLSRHEGFGVPLVEAMTHGVPVLAFGAGAVPYTLGGTARLLGDLSPDAVAGEMLALADDADARARQVAAQFRSLDRFALPLQARVLQDALLRAGAALPADPGPADSGPADPGPADIGPADTIVANGTTQDGTATPPADPNRNWRFSVTGHVNGTYSLAAINRDLVLALEDARPGRARLLPVEGAPTLDLSGVPATQAAAIRRLALRPPHETGPELVISQHYPVLVPRAGADLAVALLFWEESRLPADTVSLLGRHFDAVVAPTRFVREVLIESGLPIPVRVIPPALRLGRFLALGAARSSESSPVHRFLHVSSCFPRKGVDVLLRAWAMAFRAGDPVSLVIKGFPNPHNDVASQLDALRARDPGIAPVTLLDRDLDEDALLELYRDADTAVLPTRGEGLNLPAAEALAAGLGLIVTGAGGHMDFCVDPGNGNRVRDGVRLLRFRTAPSGSHLATPHSCWLEPDEADLVAALRERAAATPSRIEPPLLPDAGAIAAAYAGLAADLLRAGPRRPARISWVSSWGVRCGVSEYSRQMLGALQRDADAQAPGLRVRVLGDRRTPVNEDDPEAAWPCWSIGDNRSLAPLAAAIAADDADAVMLQHQPGLFSFAMLADLLAHPSLRGRVVLATLHNTVDLLDLDPPLLDRLLHGLRGINRVLVHTAADLDRLRALGVRDRVTLLAHGVPASLPPGKVRNLLPDESSPVVGCYGFFLPGKGIDVLIEALPILRRRWPGTRLRLVNAEYDAAVSAGEIARCRALADALGITDAISFETGFLPNSFSLDRLSGCDVVALAYRPSREASSAALRGAMAAGVPVAVTPITLFDEAGDAVFRFAGLDAPAIAEGLDRLLGDERLRSEVQQAAQRWMAERPWTAAAQQIAGMATGLVRTARLG